MPISTDETQVNEYPRTSTSLHAPRPDTDGGACPAHAGRSDSTLASVGVEAVRGLTVVRPCVGHVLVTLPTPERWHRLGNKQNKQHQNNKQQTARSSNKRPMNYSLWVTNSPAHGVKTEVIMVGSDANVVMNSPCGESTSPAVMNMGLATCRARKGVSVRRPGFCSPKTKSPRWRHGLFKDGNACSRSRELVKRERYENDTRPQWQGHRIVSLHPVQVFFHAPGTWVCAGGVYS